MSSDASASFNFAVIFADREVFRAIAVPGCALRLEAFAGLLMLSRAREPKRGALEDIVMSQRK